MVLKKLLGGEEIAAMPFKRVADAWIFQAPRGVRRLFGLAAHYRVNEAQKEQIAAIYLRVWRITMLGMVPLIVLIVSLSKAVPILGHGYDLALGALSGGVLALIVWSYYGAALRSILAGAAPSQDSVSLMDQQCAMINAIPTWRAVLFVAFAALMFVLAALPLEQPLPMLYRVFSMVMFGFIAVYFAAVLAMKLTRKPGA